jgi:hypothetical protein
MNFSTVSKIQLPLCQISLITLKIKFNKKDLKSACAEVTFLSLPCPNNKDSSIVSHTCKCNLVCVTSKLDSARTKELANNRAELCESNNPYTYTHMK